MSYMSFPLDLKSTLDFQVSSLASNLGLPFVDLAASSFDSSILESDQPAICWEFATIQEHSIDPMWLVTFDVGAITHLDPSQYLSLNIVGNLLEKFKQGNRIEIYDYTQATVSPLQLGAMTVTQTNVIAQQQSEASGVRFVTVTANALRFQ